jgi:hypothetical protein
MPQLLTNGKYEKIACSEWATELADHDSRKVSKEAVKLHSHAVLNRKGVAPTGIAQTGGPVLLARRIATKQGTTQPSPAEELQSKKSRIDRHAENSGRFPALVRRNTVRFSSTAWPRSSR